jgi:esterase/lipase superfamily enzyme
MNTFLITTRQFNISKQKFCGKNGDATFLNAVTPLTDRPFILLAKSDIRWQEELKSKMERKKFSKILIYIHGYNTTIYDSIKTQKKIQDNLREVGNTDTVVIGFDWASKGHIFEYFTDIANSTKAAKVLAENIKLLPILKEAFGDFKFETHILAHSMGCKLILNTLRDLEIDLDLNSLTLTAADVNQSDIPHIECITRHVKSVYNFYSKHDMILRIAEFITNSNQERVGRIGAHQIDSINNIACSMYYDYQYNSILNKLNFINSHSWYFNDVSFYNHLTSILGINNENSI